MGFIGDMFGGGDDAGDAAIKASETQAQWQKDALEYMKQREALPQQYREGALNKLGGIYGLPGLSTTYNAGNNPDLNKVATNLANNIIYNKYGIGSNSNVNSEQTINQSIGSDSNYNQQQFINEILQSPLYQNIMGGLDAGENSIMRNAAATGGLRSGNTQYALADYNTQLQNKALLESYNQQLMGLQGMAGLPSMAPAIAGGMSDIGTTYGQGIIAAAQANQAGGQNNANNFMGLGALGISAYNSGMFSDRRLKKNIKIVGKTNGFNWYSFTWNSVAEKLGLSGNTYGIMADEVFAKIPQAVSLKDGFMFVNYAMIGVL